MRVIVAGSREFTDRDFAFDKIYDTSEKRPITLIISGGARGAVRLGELWAKYEGVDIQLFKPDWGGLGKSAGFVRNVEMAKNADALIAFWDGESRGTKHMIDTALILNLETHVYIVGVLDVD